MSNEAKTSKSVDPKYWFNLAVEHFMIEGKSDRSSETYAREIKHIAKYYKKPLNTLTEDEIRKFIIYRKNECNLSVSSMKILYCGLKFLYRDILGIDFYIFENMKVQTEFRLPDVLTVNEVAKVLNHLSTFHAYSFFRTVYTCGLRVSEALNLQVYDIDGTRMVIKVNGKGSKERYIPLPPATYELLRLYWNTHKNPKLIFPALGRDLKKGPVSTTPMVLSSVQKTLKDAARSAKVRPDIVRPHVLRHSYATHLLEAGVSIRAIQKYLGHADLKSTMIYLHLTNIQENDSIAIINSIMGDRPLMIPFDDHDIALPISQQAANRCRKLGRPPKKQTGKRAKKNAGEQ
ncbi:integrase [bacterium]|nr:MAG: integrase [bacterium]